MAHRERGGEHGVSFSFVWVSVSLVTLCPHAFVSFRFWCLGSCLQPEIQTVPENAGAMLRDGNVLCVCLL